MGENNREQRDAIFQDKKAYWEQRWSNEAESAQWIDRGIAPELELAYNQQWLPRQGRVLDIGCGVGDTAAWFAGKGYDVVGIDISESAINKGSDRHKQLTNLRLEALDICWDEIPGGPFDIVIDRGCLHQIPQQGVMKYIHHVDRIVTPESRFVLFAAAYRSGNPFGDPEEKQKHIRWVHKHFKNVFRLTQVNDAFLDKDYGKGPAEPLTGIVFWMIR